MTVEVEMACEAIITKSVAEKVRKEVYRFPKIARHSVSPSELRSPKSCSLPKRITFKIDVVEEEPRKYLGLEQAVDGEKLQYIDAKSIKRAQRANRYESKESVLSGVYGGTLSNAIVKKVFKVQNTFFSILVFARQFINLLYFPLNTPLMTQWH